MPNCSTVIESAETPDREVEFLARLTEMVLDECWGVPPHHGQVRRGPIEINYYSICFWLARNVKEGEDSVYVKIPKADALRQTILPITNADRALAEGEYESLRILSALWDGKGTGVEYVKLVTFVSTYNAIVTRKVHGEDMLALYRRSDLLRRWNRRHFDDAIPGILFRIGQALAGFHRKTTKEAVFSAGKVWSKIEGYCRELVSFGVEIGHLGHLLQILAPYKGLKTNTYRTVTLKGLDIRNVLADATGRVFLFDPGRMKEDFREADLARFLVTCRILYWGSCLFFLRLRPGVTYEEKFLEGYYYYEDTNQPTFPLLFFMLKELLKQWHHAHVALSMKRWPRPVKWFLRHTYINPYYQQQIKETVKGLGAQ